MKTFALALIAAVVSSRTTICPKGEFPVNHQYDKIGQATCGCADPRDPCRKNMGPKGAHCVPSKSCKKSMTATLKARILRRRNKKIASLKK